MDHRSIAYNRVSEGYAREGTCRSSPDEALHHEILIIRRRRRAINHTTEEPKYMNRKLRMGMIGGGKNAFIGAVHRIAANLDGLIELVCGALSSNPVTAKESGLSLFLPEDRIYGSYKEMIIGERDKLFLKLQRDKSYDLLLAGCLFMGGLFFFGFFVYRSEHF